MSNLLEGSHIAFCVLSADHGLSAADNILFRENMVDDLNRARFNWHHCIGSYKGQEESSFLVLTRNWDDVREIFEIARYFRQESVLVVDDKHYASLAYLADIAESNPIKRSVNLGKWTPIAAEAAKQLDAWTLYGGQYFATLPETVGV